MNEKTKKLTEKEKLNIYNFFLTEKDNRISVIALKFETSVYKVENSIDKYSKINLNEKR